MTRSLIASGSRRIGSTARVSLSESNIDDTAQHESLAERLFIPSLVVRISTLRDVGSTTTTLSRGRLDTGALTNRLSLFHEPCATIVLCHWLIERLNPWFM